MVITRVTDYRGGACLARILSTLEDNVHLAHLWPGTGRAHLWAYTPEFEGVKPPKFPNVFAPAQAQAPGPNVLK